MENTPLPAKDMRKPQYIKKSSLKNIGLQLYSYWILKDGYISLPSDTAVHVAYIIEGYGISEIAKVKAGDVVAFGLNRAPVRFSVHNMRCFILDMDFSLFYSITGLIPSISNSPLFLDKTNLFFQMGQRLFPHPVKYWIHNIEIYIPRMLEKSNYPISDTLKRVIAATRELKREDDFNAIANGLNVSYRQLQRDFNSILGLTPKEYRSILRFYVAAHSLKREKIVDVARISGFFDQSHMTKEIKKRSGWTPKELSGHYYF